ncbi:hypothetical protein Fmac_029093 [Flemingia macrophylla]|uniref:Uncharacterized protein n=1 Tax=Flemingia macrophylla TaxID=520843 RepID=A0ABD1L9C8_9FABA
MEEDLILINYIANHGEGVWNSLAKAAGLKRTGKSCRLRWLNYLRPDVRRGNITPEEQLLIMELHAKWGNSLERNRGVHRRSLRAKLQEKMFSRAKRWSKIAKHLPGRTDNEIKNYWRTRIQKHIKQADQSFQQQEEASTSQVSTMAEPMETYSAPCYQGMLDPFSTQFPTNPDHSTTRANENNNYWSMEDIWSMQLLNGD